MTDVTSSEKRGFYLSIRLKMLLLFTLLFTLAFSLAFYWFYTFATRLAMDNLYNDLIATAHAAASGLEGDVHQALYEDPAYDEAAGWPEGMTDERFWEMARWLATIQASNPRAFPYTYVSPEPGVVEFIVSGGAVQDPPVGAAFGARYEPQPPSLILEGLEEETLSTSIVQDEYGAWISGFVPIQNSSGEIVAAVGVDFQADTVIELQDRIRTAVLPAFGVTYVVLFGAVLLISNNITAPIRSLTETASHIGEGRYEPADVRQGFLQDEVTTLTKAFNVMIERVRVREERLKKRVAKLQLEIDQTKRKKQVDEITDSQFFQDLLEKARVIRAERDESEE
jgi:HAMP domain-containing protein